MTGPDEVVTGPGEVVTGPGEVVTSSSYLHFERHQQGLNAAHSYPDS